MVKHILQIVITTAIGLLIYIFFQMVLSLPGVIGFLLAFIPALALSPVIERICQHLCNKLSQGRFAKIDQEVEHFDQAINKISHYHELFPQFYHLFNILFPKKSWLFYVFENSGFRFIEFDTSLSEEALPIEINFNLPDNGGLMFDLTPLKKLTVIEAGFSVSDFLDHHLDTVIVIKGKTQIVALLFVRQSNLDFLRRKRIKAKMGHILSKSGQFLESTGLYLDVIQRNLEIKKLFEVSKKLLTSLNTDEILDFLLDELGEVIFFDAGVIFLLDRQSTKLMRKVSKGYKNDLDLTLKFGEGACGWVAETHQISIISDVELAEHYYPIRPETRSQISLPLLWQEELMGVLSLESDVKGHFSTHTLELLKLFANQAAIALHNARQYEISLTKKSLEYELIHAGKVQKVLLPQRSPHFENLNISFAHISSKIVSGDLFDLVPIDKHLLGLVIGDVSGKGAAAAIMMSLVLAGFRAFRKSHLAVCEVVARLNNLLQESVSEGNYATLFYALMSTRENTITYSNAGHNPPMIFRSEGTIDNLTVGGIVLGYLENQVYKQTTLPFNPGDLLLSYTDGITEALNPNGEEFGEERLQTVVKKNIHLNSYDLKNTILHEVNTFTKSDDISDDRTLVVVKYT